MTGLEVAAVVAATAAVASAGYGAYTASQQANYQADMMRRQAQIEEQNAQRARFAATVQSQDADRAAREMLGRMAAEQGASGLSMNSRSYELRMKGERDVARTNALRTIYEGDMAAWNARERAAQANSQASAYKAEGRSALISGAIDMVGAAASGYSAVNKAMAVKPATADSIKGFSNPRVSSAYARRIG